MKDEKIMPSAGHIHQRVLVFFKSFNFSWQPKTALHYV